MFDELRHRPADRRLTIEVTEEARHLIVKRGYDPVYGARPLRLYIAHEVETSIGRALLAGDVHDGAVLLVDVGAGQLVVEAREPATSGAGR
jgi:ATP-dependent Clp protease ATP-binding subunit ClpB